MRFAGLSWLWVAVTILSPASVLNVVFGQNGHATAALMVLGVVAGARHRTILAAISWAVLATKPHLGVCVLPMLAGQRRYAIMAIGAAALAAFIGFTLLRYGLWPWERFLLITTGR